jgi:hypothetical protein
VQPVLYRLPRVVAADTVLVVEGEKDVETAERLSLPPNWAATSNPFGACQWQDEYTHTLEGKAVYICPDNDRAGQDHLHQVGLSLVGKAREIRVVTLPPTVKDLSEWVEAGADAAAFGVLLREAELFAYPLDDSELVRDVRSLVDALALVSKLRGVVFEHRRDPSKSEPAAEIGFVTQEVALVIPGWIGADSNGNPTTCVNGFEALAVAAIQELSARMRAASEQQSVLVARLARLADSNGRSG